MHPCLIVLRPECICFCQCSLYSMLVVDPQFSMSSGALSNVNCAIDNYIRVGLNASEQTQQSTYTRMLHATRTKVTWPFRIMCQPFAAIKHTEFAVSTYFFAPQLPDPYHHHHLPSRLSITSFVKGGEVPRYQDERHGHSGQRQSRHQRWSMRNFLACWICVVHVKWMANGDEWKSVRLSKTNCVVSMG